LAKALRATTGDEVWVFVSAMPGRCWRADAWWP